MIYLDNNSTTQIHPIVLETMLPFLIQNFGNPASLHTLGMDAKNAVDSSRQFISKAIRAKPKEIVFTSGGTEANNLAILGSAFVRPERRHLIISAIEHESVTNPAKRLENDGYKLTILKVDRYGNIDPDELISAISEETFLVSIAIANHEIGTIQNIKLLSEIAHSKGIWFHTDAAQALGKIPFNVANLGIDMASFTAHKLHGPKGVGALYAGRNTRPNKIMEGTSQEYSLRPGTENVSAIVGFGKAVDIAINDLEEVCDHVRPMQKRLSDGLKEIKYSTLNGGGVEDRLLGNLSFKFGYIEGEAILMHLSNRGIYVSSGSTCGSNSDQPSTVLTAIGHSPEEANSTIRFSLSRFNSLAEIEDVVKNVKQVVKLLRDMTPGVPD